jgi:hypothetical protein
LAAMMVSSPEGRERIAKMLSARTEADLDTEGIGISVATVVRLDEGALPNDIVLQSLINYGMGVVDCVGKAKATRPSPHKEGVTVPVWQDPDSRVSGSWDSSDSVKLSDGSLSFVKFIVEQQQLCNYLLGREGKKQSSAAVSRKLGKGK